MDLSQKIIDVIKQSKNGTLRVVLNKSGTKSLPASYKPFLMVLHKLRDLAPTETQLNASFKILDPDLIDYLLEFVVTYYEKRSVYCHVLSFPERFLPTLDKRHNNSSNFLCYFYRSLYNCLDVCRSDIHLMAFIYFSFMASILSICPLLTDLTTQRDHKTWCNTLNNNFLSYGTINKHFERACLVSPRVLDGECKGVIKRYLCKNNEIIVTINIFGSFIYNNDEFLGIFNKRKQYEILNSQTDSIGSDALYFALSIFEYDKLNEYQILSCINSKTIYYVIKSQTIDRPLNRNCTIICDRITYWLQKYPLCNIIINNLKVYKTATLVFCYLHYLARFGKTLGISPQIGSFFNRDTFKIMFNDVIEDCRESNYPLGNTFAALINTYSSNKLMDDFLMMCIVYNKMHICTKDVISSTIVSLENAKKTIRRRLIRTSNMFKLPSIK